jgi:Ca2+/Na+ antiporter
MPIAVTLALLLFWLVLAYRQFERGDLMLAAIFLFVGVVLTVYRIRQAQSRSQTLASGESQSSNAPNTGQK